jgi:hypothetical protein
MGRHPKPFTKTEVSGLARHVRFTLRTRHRQPAPTCPFGAITRHLWLSKFWCKVTVLVRCEGQQIRCKSR